MKKIMFMIMVSALIFLTGCGNKNQGPYQELTLDELKGKVEAKDDFILVLGASTCSACASYKLTMAEVVEKYDVTVYYLEGDKLEAEEKAELLKIVYYASTPTTVYFTDGKVSSTHNRIVGAANYDAVVEEFKDNGYIGK